MFLSTNSGTTLFVCCATSFAKCNKFNRPTPPVTFSLTGQTGATPVPAQSLHPSSHPTVLSRFRCLVHTHLHTPCHAKSGGFFVHAVAEPLRLSLSVLPGPKWLDVLPSMWASVSVEVLPLQYSSATGHFRLGVSCIVPGTSCLSTARNTTKAPVTTLLQVLLLPVCPLYLRQRLLAQVVLSFVFLFALRTPLCFPFFSCLVLPVDASTSIPAAHSTSTTSTTLPHTTFTAIQVKASTQTFLSTTQKAN